MSYNFTWNQFKREIKDWTDQRLNNEIVEACAVMVRGTLISRAAVRTAEIYLSALEKELHRRETANVKKEKKSLDRPIAP